MTTGPIWIVDASCLVALDTVAESQSDVLDALSDLGRLTAGPPGIPAAQLAVLRQAHLKALSDPGLIAEAAKANLPIQPGDGDFVARRIKESLTQTPDTIALLKAAARAE